MTSTAREFYDDGVQAASYVHGASATPLLGETIGECLRRTVDRHGDREALVVRQNTPGRQPTHHFTMNAGQILSR